MGVTPFDLVNPLSPKSSLEIQKQRINECKKCDQLVPVVKACKKCGCVMPFKVTLQKATCPLNKW